MTKEENIIASSLGEQLYTMISDDTPWDLLLDEAQARWHAAATEIYDKGRRDGRSKTLVVHRCRVTLSRKTRKE